MSNNSLTLERSAFDHKGYLDELLSDTILRPSWPGPLPAGVLEEVTKALEDAAEDARRGAAKVPYLEPYHDDIRRLFEKNLATLDQDRCQIG